MTVKTYQGYFLEDGRLMTNGSPIKLPTKCRVIVNVLEDEMGVIEAVAQTGTDSQKKVAAIHKILNDAQGAEDSVLTDADWDEMANLRAGTNAGLSRKTEL